jgi:hypothetical protein
MSPSYNIAIVGAPQSVSVCHEGRQGRGVVAYNDPFIIGDNAFPPSRRRHRRQLSPKERRFRVICLPRLTWLPVCQPVAG